MHFISNSPLRGTLFPDDRPVCKPIRNRLVFKGNWIHTLVLGKCCRHVFQPRADFLDDSYFNRTEQFILFKPDKLKTNF